MLKFHPAGTAGPSEGVAHVRCKVAPQGRLSDCAVISETPTGAGFGQAALRLAPKFRATPEAAQRMAGSVTLPIRFAGPPPGPPFRQAAFQTMRAYSHLGAAGPYYPDRALRMGVGAVVVADCHVGDTARLNNCQVVEATNADYGFGDAMLKMAEKGWMTAGPAPVGVAPPADGVWRFQVEFGRRGRDR
jgi:TonB family protein